MPTPAELRAATASANEQRYKRLAEETRAAAEKDSDHRRLIAESADSFIETLNSYLDRAAQYGSTQPSVSTSIGTFQSVEGDLLIYRQEVRPRIEQHYTKQGFGVEWDENHSVEYGSDGAGPGPIYVRAKVCW